LAFLHSIEMSGLTDTGLRRPSNEDSIVMLQGDELSERFLAVAGVFDGVGGRPHGDVASSLATHHLSQILRQASCDHQSTPETEMEFREVMLRIHERIRERGLQESEYRGMATTGSVVFVTNSRPPHMWIGHVGDSSIFLLRNDRLTRLTRGDSLVGEMVEMGLVTADEASRHPKRHIITQALGGYMMINPYVSYHTVEPGDRVLLCTDGLTDLIPEAKIKHILESGALNSAARRLIDASNNAGGSDNVSAVVFSYLRQ